MLRRRSTIIQATLAAILATTGLLVLAPVPTALAAETAISPVTRVADSDPSTTVGFAWHTTRTTSTSAPQPVTRLAWGLTGSFNCDTAAWSTAAVPTTTVYDRVAYSRVTLKDLTPATSYSYCVKIDGGVSSEPTTFTTAPATPASFTFLAFADAHWRSTASYQNNYANTVAKALQANPGILFSTHNGALGSSNNLTHWDGFLTHASQALTSSTWIPTALASGSSNRFFALGNALPLSSATDSANYSVREGNMLILVINTYRTDTASTNETIAWIKSQVAQLGSDQDKTWIIASVPTQFYAATSSSSTYSNKLKQAFRDAGVSLVLQGGAEAYTRSWPVGGTQGTTVWRDYPSNNSIATNDGIIYLNPGASGAQQANVPSGARSATSGWLARWTPDLSSADRLVADKKSYSAITVTADELSVVAKTAAGEELDRFTIHRNSTPQVEPRALQPFGLNNGFGADPQTARTITWLALDSAKYTAPYFKLAQGGSDIASQTAITTGCSQYALPSGLSSYTAYTCQLTGLTPDTTYTYKVGAWIGSRSYESSPYTFQTADNSGEFTFIDFADSQSTPASTYDTYWGNTLRTALDAHPEAAFVTHTGDITETSNSSNVTAWLDAVGTSLSSVAFNPVLGNHDDSTSAAPMWANLFPRQSLTAVPSYSEPSTLQYAYVYGNALFLHINTNLDTRTQLATTTAWVHSTVATYGKNADGTNRFIIVIEHKSPFGGEHSGSRAYPTGNSGNPEIVAQLPKTFYNEGVDLVLAGHDHNLIRSLPIQWSTSQNKAVWDRAKIGLTTINSDTDGLIYYIPRNSGEKTYSLITPSATSRPWIGYVWQLNDNYEAPENTVYAVVKVTQSEIEVNTYRTGDSLNPVDSFTITQSG